jgi:hypothetical protein
LLYTTVGGCSSVAVGVEGVAGDVVDAEGPQATANDALTIHEKYETRFMRGDIILPEF